MQRIMKHLHLGLTRGGVSRGYTNPHHFFICSSRCNAAPSCSESRSPACADLLEQWFGWVNSYRRIQNKAEWGVSGEPRVNS